MSSSLIPLSLNPPLLSFHLHRTTCSPPLLISFSRASKFPIRATSSSSDHEEIRWLREEQRWLREEQRWFREEQRWIRERESLLREISELKLQIKALENRNLSDGASVSVSDTISNIAGLLQEELLKLGFFSGEEDMEYSSFSTGTERAVKTWQAAMGVTEDGIMTSELLESLYMEHRVEDNDTNMNADQKGIIQTIPPKEGTNGAPIASITEISEIKQTVVKEGATEVDLSERRVFLLGENRWEEPSRLAGRGNQDAGSKAKKATTQCLTCRGEGRLMCLECDGTGEPNIEPQFIEWVDEGMKCPYCEGLGYTICDVCEGKAVV
ncbi:protein disulfide isomerase pTAC5 [Citrus sinensis]|nr:protein disulfide isomerase pTAC5 [Citrus sinensis]